MIMAPGLCCKCGRQIAGTPYYNHIVVKLQGKIPEGIQEEDVKNRVLHLMDVAICSQCDLQNDDFGPLMQAYNDYQVVNGGKALDCEITEVLERKNLVQLLAQSQGGKCIGCHEPINDKWVVSGKYVLHEGCNLPPPMSMMERAQGQLRVER